MRRSNKVPKSPYYVLSHDTFMSGWGDAKGIRNIVVVPASSYEEAKQIVNYVLLRSDQDNIQIVRTKPRPRGRLLSYIPEWRENAGLQINPFPECEWVEQE